ncbi:hypothetical protein PR048_032053 [Dryococelus australis]|uniref:Uncharacterized protein n=1 Tax=Dryococelus australis TaxID=614101 RepID=A0ABQ9G147_9NEOP|nr:hypothetical protein PR048_032053 [Dryococelus australis]
MKIALYGTASEEITIRHHISQAAYGIHATFPRLLTWLDCLPPANANGFGFQARSLPDFRMWESSLTMPLISRFSRGSPFPPHFHSGVATYAPHYTLVGSQYLERERCEGLPMFCVVSCCLWSSSVSQLHVQGPTYRTVHLESVKEGPGFVVGRSSCGFLTELGHPSLLPSIWTPAVLFYEATRMRVEEWTILVALARSRPFSSKPHTTNSCLYPSWPRIETDNSSFSLSRGFTPWPLASPECKGEGKQEIPEKIHRPVASSSTILPVQKSGSDSAGNRTLFSYVGGELSSHYTTAAP